MEQLDLFLLLLSIFWSLTVLVDTLLTLECSNFIFELHDLVFVVLIGLLDVILVLLHVFLQIGLVQ